MRNYLDSGNRDRLYDEHGDCSDLLDDQDFDYNKARAHVLGRDLARIMTVESRHVIEQCMFGNNEAERLAAALVRNNANYHRISETALEKLQALQQGLTEC